MLPAADLSEILANLSALNLQPSTAAAVLGAGLAPLLRSSDPEEPVLPRKRGRPRRKPRQGRRRTRKKARPRVVAASKNQSSGGGPLIETAPEPTDSPRQRAARALAANPGASANAVAKIAGVNRGTVLRARSELAAEARKLRENPVLAKQTERRQRAQRFLREQLARGPQPITDVEQAAEKAHLDVHALEQARADLGVVTSRGNTGGVQAVQWSLPG